MDRDTTLPTEHLGAAEQPSPTQRVRLTHRIAIDLIEVGHRIRALDYEKVEALKKSIALVELLNAVTVYRASIERDGEVVDGFRLIAGAHRLAACRGLGHAEIEVVVLELEGPRRIIVECDENLCAPQLSASERAEFTHRRKLAYEQLHPETKKGGDRRSDQTAKSAIRSFTDETAASSGKAARTVRLDAERGANIVDDALDMVKGTKLDTGAYLDQLKGMQPSEQEHRVRADLEAIDKRHKDAGAATAKTAPKGGQGDRGGKKSRHPRPDPTADSHGRFASVLEELVAFRPVHFEAWQTMGEDCRQSIKKALAYAQSAARTIQHFQNIHGAAEARHDHSQAGTHADLQLVSGGHRQRIMTR